MTRDEIAKEFDRFFEFDTEDRSTVTSVSARLFAERIAAVVAAAASERRAFELAESYRCGWDGGVKAEREACAKVCERSLIVEINPERSTALEKYLLMEGAKAGAKTAAFAIRARSNK